MPPRLARRMLRADGSDGSRGSCARHMPQLPWSFEYRVTPRVFIRVKCVHGVKAAERCLLRIYALLHFSLALVSASTAAENTPAALRDPVQVATAAAASAASGSRERGEEAVNAASLSATDKTSLTTSVAPPPSAPAAPGAVPPTGAGQERRRCKQQVRARFQNGCATMVLTRCHPMIYWRYCVRPLMIIKK